MQNRGLVRYFDSSDLESTLQIKELGQWINYSNDNDQSPRVLDIRRAIRSNFES